MRRGTDAPTILRLLLLLSAQLSLLGGGEVVLRPTTYLVGRQSANPDMSAHWAYPPMPILHFENLSGPLRIRGIDRAWTR